MNQAKSLFEGQLVLTEQGYLEIAELHKLYTEKTAPRVATWERSGNRFDWTEISHMTQDFRSEEIIRVETDVFGIIGAKHHSVWFLDDLTKRAKLDTLDNLFRHTGQFMGIHPMPSGGCSGYYVGPGCWYKEPVSGWFFDLDTKDGLVFTRTKTREAGVWSGSPVGE